LALRDRQQLCNAAKFDQSDKQRWNENTMMSKRLRCNRRGILNDDAQFYKPVFIFVVSATSGYGYAQRGTLSPASTASLYPRSRVRQLRLRL
jgi:hypothetical protein